MKAAIVLALVGVPAAAVADTGIPARARTLAERGRSYHDSGDYAAAIAAFTEAYALAPSPALLFNLAQAYRLAGRCDEAVVMYRRYLASDPDPDARALAVTHLHSVQLCSETRVDTGAPVASHAMLEKGLGEALVVGGSVALAGALYYAYRAHDDAEQVSAAYAHGGTWASIRDVDASGRHSQTMAEVCAGAGLAAAATGAVLYYFGDRGRPITVVPRAGGAEVHAAWRF